VHTAAARAHPGSLVHILCGVHRHAKVCTNGAGGAIAACCIARAPALATLNIKDYAAFVEHESLAFLHRRH
jgi:hypothetical protein